MTQLDKFRFAAAVTQPFEFIVNYYYFLKKTNIATNKRKIILN